MEQQFDAGKIGIWLFLATEVLFFGGLFTVYSIYRANHPQLYHIGQYFLTWEMGAINTAVLIFSSLTAAWAVRAAQLNQKKILVSMLVITFLCAATFMVVKYFEYSHKIHEGVLWGQAFNPSDAELNHVIEKIEHKGGDPKAIEFLEAIKERPVAEKKDMVAPLQMFFSIYFFMTGLHGIHVLVGMGLIAWLIVRASKGQFNNRYFAPVDSVALYWHIVDLIWIFLFPLFYLIG
ncbi:MAG: cytochrome c oxidase subunit 3 family protein [Planctomycetaceae bacterium]|nr:cytochrome c oxidase subunit 3 family protein [Planctomycetaceae bacterium]